MAATGVAACSGAKLAVDSYMDQVQIAAGDMVADMLHEIRDRPM